MMPDSTRIPAGLRACVALVPLLALLAGCAGGGTRSEEAPSATAQRGESESILAAEEALREGDCRRAAESYLAAARAGSDAGVASRASQLAYGCEQYGTAKVAAQRWLELAPHSGDAALAGALVAMRQHDLPESRRLLTMWRDSGSSSNQDPLRFTELLEQEVGATVVHQVFTDVLVSTDPTAEVRLAEARLAFGAQDMRKAIAAAQAALALDADLTEAAVIEVRARAVLGEYDAAISGARALGDRLDPDNAFLVSDLLVAAGRHDEARRELDRMSAKGESRLAAERRLVGLAIEEGDLAAAEARLEPMLGERGGAAIALYYLAQVYELRGDKARALQSYRLLADSSFGVQARVAAARILLKNGQRDQALALLDEFAAANPDRRVEMAVTRAQLLAQAGAVDDALKDLDAMLGKYPDHPDLLYQKATTLETGDRSREAIALMESLREARPQDPQITNALGYTMADNGVRLPRAEQYVREAIAVSPDSPAIQDSLGWVLFKQGKVAEALPVLERAWRNSQDAEIAAHFGEALWKSGDEGRARYLWQQALAREPDDALLRSTITRLTGEAPPSR
jgi:tetratricopeptide (TPR) repeat protein